MRGRSGIASKRWGQRRLVTTFSGYLSAIIATAAAADCTRGNALPLPSSPSSSSDPLSHPHRAWARVPRIPSGPPTLQPHAPTGIRETHRVQGVLSGPRGVPCELLDKVDGRLQHREEPAELLPAQRDHGPRIEKPRRRKGPASQERTGVEGTTRGRLISRARLPQTSCLFPHLDTDTVNRPSSSVIGDVSWKVGSVELLTLHV